MRREGPQALFMLFLYYMECTVPPCGPNSSSSESETVGCSAMSNSSWLFVTVAPQASLSMGFSRQEYWSGFPFPSPGDLPNPGIKPESPTLQADSLPSEPPGKPSSSSCCCSVTKSCPTLYDPMDCRQRSQASLSFTIFPEFAQTHVHRVSDAIQLSHPLSSPSPPAFNLSQHHGLF